MKNCVNSMHWDIFARAQKKLYLLPFHVKSVFGPFSFCTNYRVNTPRHTLNEFLAGFRSDLVPLSFDSLPQLQHTPSWCFISIQTILEVPPQVFYGVKVRRLSRPVLYNGKRLVTKPFLDAKPCA